MQNNIYIYIAIMVIVTTLIRVIPLTLIRKEITNRTLRSFLYYIPYVTLAVMTFPAILDATGSPISAWAALIRRYRCRMDRKEPVLRVIGRLHCRIPAGACALLIFGHNVYTATTRFFNLSDFFQKYKKYKK